MQAGCGGSLHFENPSHRFCLSVEGILSLNQLSVSDVPGMEVWNSGWKSQEDWKYRGTRLEFAEDRNFVSTFKSFV
jgi:hypothetical protein